MKTDLTRWNRAGLKRFRYVDGNAATYLESLRQELFSRLAGWDMELLGIKPSSNEPEERKKALENYIQQFGKDYQWALENYENLQNQRGSIALEMVRSFARAAHVLTEHLDAYANEGYLGTATQWENVRRLVHGLDYCPRPPTSAMTRLVLHAKPGQSGLVSCGLQIKHTPEEGEPVVFETLEDIQVDPDFNALRLKNWNRSQANLDDNNRLILDALIEGLRPDEPVVIENTEKGTLLAALLKNIYVDNECTVLELVAPDTDPVHPVALSALGELSNLVVHLKPAERLEVFAPLKEPITVAGTSSLILEEEPVQLEQRLEDEKSGFVFIGKGKKGVYRVVSGVSGRKISLDGAIAAPLDADGYVGMPRELKAEIEYSDREGRQALFVTGDMSWLEGADIFVKTAEAGKFEPAKVSSVLVEYAQQKDAEGKYLQGTRLSLETTINFGNLNATTLLVPPDVNEWKWKIDSFIDMTQGRLEVSTIKRMEAGELFVAACASNLLLGRAEHISPKSPGKSELRFLRPTEGAAESTHFIRSQTTVFGKFKEQARLQGCDRNKEPVSGDTLALEDKKAAAKLREGQLVVVEQEEPALRQSFQAQVQSVNGKTGQVTLSTPLPSTTTYFTDSTVIRANVVLAGHGETQPEKILGSGNATLSSQEFLFPASNLSFVADAAQDFGVKADIRVVVDGEPWMQVSRFNNSLATDMHYRVQVTEEGGLRIIFGDGTNGRRLPTGENNVRIAWRLGAGTAGNLAAGLLKKPAQPHPRVEAIEQPFPSEGGNDMESVTSLRRSAPASLLTMERAVSAVDFAELAVGHGHVWDARAEQKLLGKERVICLTVVPAGELSEGELSAELTHTLTEFLLARAIPGVRVELKSHVSEALKLDIFLGLNMRSTRETVLAELRETLLQRFELKNRRIGAPVYLSDVYQCVNAVRGVEYSVCKFKTKNASGGYDIDEAQFLTTESPDGVLHLQDSSDAEIRLPEEEPQ